VFSRCQIKRATPSTPPVSPLNSSKKCRNGWFLTGLFASAEIESLSHKLGFQSIPIKQATFRKRRSHLVPGFQTFISGVIHQHWSAHSWGHTWCLPCSPTLTG
jgi:hypothetical protein